MRTSLSAGFCLFAALLLAAATVVADEPPKKAVELFAQRASTALFGQAMREFDIFYSKHEPDYDKALFLARAYFYHGERYGIANPKKAVSSHNLGVKWADYALGKKPDDYAASFYSILCRQRAGTLKTKVESVEAFKKAKDSFEPLAEKHPDKSLALRALGELYREAPDWPVGYRDLDKSEKLLAKAFKLSPEDPETALEYARTLIVNKKFSEARGILTRIDSQKDEQGWEVEAGLAKQAAKEELKKIRGKF